MSSKNPSRQLSFYQGILQGTYPKEVQTLNFLKRFLNFLMPTSICPTDLPFPVGGVHNSLTGQILPCVDFNERYSLLLQNLLQNNQLTHSFNYLKSVSDQLGGRIRNEMEVTKKLLTMCGNFLKIDVLNSNLTAIEKKTVIQAYFNLFESISKPYPGEANPKISKLRNLSLDLFNKFNFNTSVTTLISEATTAHNQTIPYFSHDSVVTKSPDYFKFTTNIFSQNMTFPIEENMGNQTRSHLDPNTLENNHFSLASNVSTTIGLSALTGFINGVGEVILHILERKNCSINARRGVAATFALINSLGIPALPFIRLLMERLDNDQNDSDVNSQEVWECICAFTLSVIPQIAKMTLHCVTSEKSILKNIINLFSFSAILWPLVNGEADIHTSLIVIIAMITSIAFSILTSAGLNKILPFFAYLFEKKNNLENTSESETKRSLNSSESDTPLLNLSSSNEPPIASNKPVESDSSSVYLDMNSSSQLKEPHYKIARSIQPSQRSSLQKSNPKGAESEYIMSDTNTPGNNMSIDSDYASIDEIKMVNYNRPLPPIPTGNKSIGEPKQPSALTHFFTPSNEITKITEEHKITKVTYVPT